MNLSDMIIQMQEMGYELDGARARVCQDIVLKAISVSSLSKNVTIKGGVVMRSITNDIRRATRNLEPALKFEIIEQPNDWTKEMRKPSGSIERTALPKIRDMLQWGAVSAGDILVAKGYESESELLVNGQVIFNSEEMSMQDWLRRVTGWIAKQYRLCIQEIVSKRCKCRCWYWCQVLSVIVLGWKVSLTDSIA